MSKIYHHKRKEQQTTHRSEENIQPCNEREGYGFTSVRPEGEQKEVGKR
jgi:hypothetical protein